MSHFKIRLSPISRIFIFKEKRYSYSITKRRLSGHKKSDIMTSVMSFPLNTEYKTNWLIDILDMKVLFTTSREVGRTMCSVESGPGLPSLFKESTD